MFFLIRVLWFASNLRNKMRSNFSRGNIIYHSKDVASLDGAPPFGSMTFWSMKVGPAKVMEKDEPRKTLCQVIPSK